MIVIDTILIELKNVLTYSAILKLGVYYLTNLSKNIMEFLNDFISIFFI